MTKILFLIPTLGQGGAEKVLVNLVNNMDPDKFDVSVIALFGGGVNEQFLKPHIHYRAIFKKIFPGNSHVMKLFSPKTLHRLFVKEHYDIEVSYLEGPSARIISGCQNPDTKLVAWVHCTMQSEQHFAQGFRNAEEARNCYNCMAQMVFVSNGVQQAFLPYAAYQGEAAVVYNTMESSAIRKTAEQGAEEIRTDAFTLAAVGTLKEVKGYDRLLRVMDRLHKEQYPVHLYFLGTGPLQAALEAQIEECSLQETVTFLGYRTDAYRFVSKCDLLVCSSHSEGFSTAVTEALIVGTPVCTVEVSGMKELLGRHNEYGIVTANNEEALYQGIRSLLDDPSLIAHYREKAAQRGRDFDTAKTVKVVEEMFERLKEESL